MCLANKLCNYQDHSATTAKISFPSHIDAGLVSRADHQYLVHIHFAIN